MRTSAKPRTIRVRSFIALVLKLLGLWEQAEATKEARERQEKRDDIESDPIDYANSKFGVRPKDDDGEAS